LPGCESTNWFSPSRLGSFLRLQIRAPVFIAQDNRGLFAALGAICIFVHRLVNFAGSLEAQSSQIASENFHEK